MAWYAIVWREDTTRKCSINVPNFGKWCHDNEETLFVKLGIRGGDNAATLLVAAWDRTWGDCAPAFEVDKGDRIYSTGNEYYARVGVLPEHAAPKMEYFGDDEWWWHWGDKDDGTPRHRTVMAIEQFNDVQQARDRAEDMLEDWSDAVDKFDTHEWNSDRKSMRLGYQDFREWVHQNAGIMPPELEPEAG